MVVDHHQAMGRLPLHMMIPRASLSTTVKESPTESVKERYDQMLKTLDGRNSPPNASLWSLIENCANEKDIELLFDILQRLRVFRLSNLRIHTNFNINLCRNVTKACVRAGALEFGKKSISKHNVYGLTPNVGSVNYLLLYAKKHNDANLMEEIMKLRKQNDIPLQARTVDIAFRICYNRNNWKLMSKYLKKFLKEEVKLRLTSFDTLMEFAAQKGDPDSLWRIEKLRSESMMKHSIVTGFACAKGYLLEHKPKDAAATIQVLNQNLSDGKRRKFVIELRALATKWPSAVIKQQKEEERKGFAAALQTDISTMVTGLLDMGIEASINMEDLTKEAVPC